MVLARTRRKGRARQVRVVCGCQDFQAARRRRHRARVGGAAARLPACAVLELDRRQHAHRRLPAQKNSFLGGQQAVEGDGRCCQEIQAKEAVAGVAQIYRVHGPAPSAHAAAAAIYTLAALKASASFNSEVAFDSFDIVLCATNQMFDPFGAAA